MILQQSDYSNRAYKFAWKVIIIFIIIVCTKIIYDNSHAEIKHGIEAIQTRQCIRNNNPTIVLYNSTLNRYLRFCEISKGTWGQQLLYKTKGKDEYNEITAYIRDNVHSKDDIIIYAKNNALEVINISP